MTPAAVLWDMDGTLVDTEPYWMECEYALAAQFGGEWSESDAHSIVGFDLLDAAAVLRARAGIDLEPRQIVGRLLDGVVERIHRHLPWRPGARELLAECRERSIPCALVTMSWRRCADAVVDEVPVGSFDQVVTGDMVTNGKPHPEPYLTAARLLGVPPGRCVAIEDSPTGAASALAAGCATLGVPHVVDLAPAAGLTIAGTLTGIGADELGGLLTP